MDRGRLGGEGSGWPAGGRVEGGILVLKLYLLKIARSLSSGSGGDVPLCGSTGTPVRGHVSSLVSHVALRRGVLRLGRCALKQGGGIGGINRRIGGMPSRVNSLVCFSVGPRLHGGVRGGTVRRSHLNVPVVFNCSTVRKFHAVCPVSLKRTYS